MADQFTPRTTAPSTTHAAAEKVIALPMQDVAVLSADTADLPDNGPVRVLVVEDEERLGDAIRRGLVAEGFVVDVETNGADGSVGCSEPPVRRDRPRHHAAELNGYDVCKQLRADENWTPVIMLTAKDGDLDQVDAFDLGADDYLTNRSPRRTLRAAGSR